WLPNRVMFPGDKTKYAVGPNVPQGAPRLTTRVAPLQKFRWGDYTVEPGHTYRYRVYARYGKPEDIIAAPVAAALADPFVEVTVTTEDPPNDPECSVFFNRGAAASEAYN